VFKSSVSGSIVFSAYYLYDTEFVCCGDSYCQLFADDGNLNARTNVWHY
jgi:hypothetical protein